MYLSVGIHHQLAVHVSVPILSSLCVVAVVVLRFAWSAIHG